MTSPRCRAFQEPLLFVNHPTDYILGYVPRARGGFTTPAGTGYSPSPVGVTSLLVPQRGMGNAPLHGLPQSKSWMFPGRLPSTKMMISSTSKFNTTPKGDSTMRKNPGNRLSGTKNFSVISSQVKIL
ncbi:hypothetical protein GWK47_049800 [Chionoecetes opilio]|uniref:Uncharacterized protein n=1 Tax=Chionoecetes opilio TaxID=41210 RepID=A0A8J4Y8Z9_CHIOP|nr:hypothetical protein GWK47_049800 [Chionoecetes opilio]